MLIEYRCQCPSCGGTGLYVGLAERDGIAVVCHDCFGQGYQDRRIEYKIFEHRQAVSGIKQVYATNPGIVVDDSGIVSGGVSLTEWVADPASALKPGAEMRSHVCPAWWYQAADYSKKPDWKECPGFGAFSKCPFFSQKDRCWIRWDREGESQ